MIRYSLECHEGHSFEGWFRSSGDYDAQHKARRVECPICGTARVKKSLMAPAIAKSAAPKAMPQVPEPAVPRQAQAQTHGKPPSPAERAKFYAAVRAHVEANFEDVGKRFPEEARKIHHGESEERGIFGEASLEEARDLIEDGIAVAPLPPDEREIN